MCRLGGHRWTSREGSKAKSGRCVRTGQTRGDEIPIVGVCCGRARSSLRYIGSAIGRATAGWHAPKGRSHRVGANGALNLGRKTSFREELLRVVEGVRYVTGVDDCAGERIVFVSLQQGGSIPSGCHLRD